MLKQNIDAHKMQDSKKLSILVPRSMYLCIPCESNLDIPGIPLNSTLTTSNFVFYHDMAQRCSVDNASNSSGLLLVAHISRISL